MASPTSTFSILNVGSQTDPRGETLVIFDPHMGEIELSGAGAETRIRWRGGPRTNGASRNSFAAPATAADGRCGESRRGPPRRARCPANGCPRPRSWSGHSTSRLAGGPRRGHLQPLALSQHLAPAGDLGHLRRRQHGLGNGGLFLTELGWMAVTPGEPTRLVEASTLSSSSPTRRTGRRTKRRRTRGGRRLSSGPWRSTSAPPNPRAGPCGRGGRTSSRTCRPRR
jgi:hypothetical protein